MSLPRFVTLLVCATSALFLTSCGFSGRADAVNPTISEMDALDVQWGLPARKSRGGPRRTYQFVDSGTNSAAATTQAPAAAAAPARETVNGQPPAMIAPEPPAAAPSTVPASLR
jgi:hypothetical protein